MEGILDRYERVRKERRASQAPFSLAGEVAVVTGASGRLGQYWIRALDAAGCEVIQPTDTDDAAHGDSPFRHTIPNTADISSRRDVERILISIRSCYGTPTILINNAGVDSRPSMTNYDAMTEAMVQCNLRGTDLMLQVFGEAMAAEGYGSIINIASLYGIVSPDLRYYDHRDDGWVKDPMYGATKAGVIALTRYYAAKYATKGVRVNALAPGGIVAPGDGLTAQDPQFVAKYTSRIPMGRMCSPEDLSGPLVFLASKASSFVTGQTIALDGGYLCW
jgi:NAD(P)-dependent dehydrogenase (short-subunit alcohol dehydrogenase family)